MNPRKELVLDANILLRAAFGTRVRQLPETYADVAGFYSPDVCLGEAQEYIPHLGKRQGIDSSLDHRPSDHRRSTAPGANGGAAAVRRSGQVKTTTRAKKCRMFVETALLLFWALDRLSRKGVLETLRHLNRQAVFDRPSRPRPLH